MQAFLDDRPINAERPSLAGALAAGAAMAESAGRIIVEVTLDGHDLAGEQLDRPSDDDLGDAEVRLVSADPRELAAKALADAGTQLGATRTRQAACAELVQTGRLAEAMDELGACLAEWQAAQAVVQSVTQLLRVAPDDTGGAIDALAARLDELRSALGAEDWATLADLLAYDLDEQAERWIGMLDAMRREVEA